LQLLARRLRNDLDAALQWIVLVEQREARVDLIEADSPEAAGVELANRMRDAKLI